ncbi:hypothetical protein [Kitasatospora herbaricolor]|uniref:hypothetical protein n=1 Tax=Kitasatospora herbaricolor TaxID=68217 RepID=UPI0036DB4FF0
MTAIDAGGRPPLDGPGAHLAPALLAWAADESPARSRLCLLTGPPNSGKTRLLAWLLAGSTGKPRPTVHAVGFAAGHIPQTLAWQLGRHLGYGPLAPAGLLARLAEDPRPVLLLITDLHRAGRGPAHLPAATPHAVISELLTPLLSLPNVRAAVEVDDPDLLPHDSALVLDLGHPRHSHPASMHHPIPVPRAETPDVLTGFTAGPVTAPAGSASRPPAGPGTDWLHAGDEDREHALDHALRAGQAAQLLTDPGYLVHGSVAAITATLADDTIVVPRRLRATWRQAAPALAAPGLSDPERAAILHSAALGHDPKLAAFLQPLTEQHHWTTGWRRPTGRVLAATILRPGTDQLPTLVTADPLGRLTRRNAVTGTARSTILSPPVLRPAGLCAVGDDCLLALDSGGSLHPIPVEATGAISGGAEHLAHHHNAASLGSPRTRPTAVAADRDKAVVADADGTIHLWSIADHRTGPRTHRLHTGAITSVACLFLSRTGTTLAVTGALDGTVRLWDSASGRPMPQPVEQRNALPTALAMADTDAGPVLAVAWSDRLLHLWNLLEGRMTPVPLLHDAEALTLTGNQLTVAGRHGITAIHLDLDSLWNREH